MSEISVGQYLFSRIKGLGIKSVFGVPGGMPNSLPSLQYPPVLEARLKRIIHRL